MKVNGIDLYVEDRGSGPPVLLLHGWPDTSRLWRHQIPHLHDAGFRTVAPDLRGFGRSAKPEDVGEYAFRHLRADALAILDQLDIERAHVVGHDWGAALAWSLAINAPERVERLVVISAPHEAVPVDLEQHQRFWYQLLFQFEDVAEAWVAHDNWRFFRELIHADGDVDQYVEDLSRPGALTASLNIYRANARPRPPVASGAPRRVTSPTMVVWPSNDQFLTERRMMASLEFVDAESEFVTIEGSSHWAPVDAPDRVTDVVLAWLTKDFEDAMS